MLKFSNNISIKSYHSCYQLLFSQDRGTDLNSGTGMSNAVSVELNLATAVTFAPWASSRPSPAEKNSAQV